MQEHDKFIALSVPNLKGNELKYITEAVETEWVSTAGPYVAKFEEELARYVGTPRAVSCQSGTAGLHTALIVAGVEPGDMVIVPTLTFIAAVNPVKYSFAEPAFMDCDDSLCMDPVKLAKFCEEECDFTEGKLVHIKSGRRVKAMVVVHVFGNMADMEAIMPIANKFNIKVIEDATEAIGTYYTQGIYKGKFAGTIGDIGVYSFNGNKIITTGGGGMIVSNNEEYLDHAKHLTTQAKADEANFIHDEIGYNYRMTNLQAAMGLAQLEQLEDFIVVKTANYKKYAEAFGYFGGVMSGADSKKCVDSAFSSDDSGINITKQGKVAGLSITKFREGIRPNYWFYSLYVDKPFDKNQREVIDGLKAKKIQTRPIWGLIHEQKPYEGSLAYNVETAKVYWEHVVNLPCSTNLTKEDVDRVIDSIKSL